MYYNFLILYTLIGNIKVTSIKSVNKTCILHITFNKYMHYIGIEITRRKNIIKYLCFIT